MMQIKTSLFDCCAQADRFKVIFRKADPEVLNAEISKLHSQCEGEAILVSKQIKFVCSCPCHKKEQSNV